MGINIRAMIQADKPGIMQILGNTPEFKPSEVVVAEEVINSYLDEPYRSGYHILVAELDSIVAGYICFGPTPLTEGTWDLYWIVVAADKQRQGIGVALLELAEKKMRKAEGRLALIETSSLPAYERARQFYIRYGYETIGGIPDFYAPGDDKLILQKHLR